MACRPTEVPGVDQDIEAQSGDEARGINLGRRIVSDRRNIDQTVKETWQIQKLVQCGKRGRPAAQGIVLRALWSFPEWSKQKHVMEANDMLQDASGIPLTAG